MVPASEVWGDTATVDLLAPETRTGKAFRLFSAAWKSRTLECIQAIGWK